MLQSFTTYYGHMIAGFEFAALETAYFSSRPGKPANMLCWCWTMGSVILRFIQHPGNIHSETILRGSVKGFHWAGGHLCRVFFWR